MTDVIRASGLVKIYGKLRALDGLDFAVPEGTILGLLGQNGAGQALVARPRLSPTNDHQARAR